MPGFRVGTPKVCCDSTSYVITCPKVNHLPEVIELCLLSQSETCVLILLRFAIFFVWIACPYCKGYGGHFYVRQSMYDGNTVYPNA